MGENTKKEKMETVFFLVRRIIPLTFKIFPGLITLSTLIMVIQASIPLVHVYITANLINTIEQLIGGNSSFLSAVAWLAFQGGINIFSGFLTICEQLLQKKMSFKVSYHFEKLVLEKTQKLSFIHYETPESYDLLAQTNGAGERGIQILMSLRVVCMYSITITGYIITLLHYSWMLPALILVLAIPNIIINIKISNQRYVQMLLQSPISRKATYITQLFKSRDSIKEIKLYKSDGYLINKWKTIYWKQSNEKYKLEKYASIMGFNFDNVGSLSILLATGLLIYIASSGKLSLGEYVALTAAITTSYAMIRNIANSLSRMYEDSLFAKKLYLFLDLPEEEKSSTMVNFPEKLNKGIEVRDLSFWYPNQKNESLKNVSFTVRPGEKIAIVGYNGAGKTTLIKCLLGLYPVSSGTVLFDGIDINEMNVDTLRQNISVIFQDFIRYNLTVRENIGLGNINMLENDPLLKNAAVKAEIDQLIENLPQGYDTELGHQFIGGRELSGGQWQKIAISRAFLKNSQIVIFDEPTSALDPLAEAQIFEKIMDIAQDKIAIFISHRLSSCTSADRILVFKDGQLEEEGNHFDLMNRNGFYAEMFMKQSQKYVQTV